MDSKNVHRKCTGPLNMVVNDVHVKWTYKMYYVRV